MGKPDFGVGEDVPKEWSDEAGTALVGGNDETVGVANGEAREELPGGLELVEAVADDVVEELGGAAGDEDEGVLGAERGGGGDGEGSPFPADAAEGEEGLQGIEAAKDGADQGIDEKRPVLCFGIGAAFGHLLLQVVLFFLIGGIWIVFERSRILSSYLNFAG